MFRVLYTPQFRQIASQIAVIMAVGSLLTYLGHNAATNLREQGIASGFGFLSDRAGFSIIQPLIPYSEESSYGRAFWVGLLNTGLISGLGLLLATILGFALGIARLSSHYLIAKLASVYVEVVRNIPLLLQVFFWYFVVLRSLPGPRQSLNILDLGFINNRGIYLPTPQSVELIWLALILGTVSTGWAAYRFLSDHLTQLAARCGDAIAVILAGGTLLTLAKAEWSIPALRGFNFSGGICLIPEFSALLAALSIYTAAFIAEIVRAGILSVGRGQHEAAAALGLKPWQTLRFIVIPQALRVIIPPLTSQYLNLTKNSSLGAAIAYPDLVGVFAGTVLNQTGQAVEVISMTMGVYLALSLAISLLMNGFNRTFAIKGRPLA